MKITKQAMIIAFSVIGLSVHGFNNWYFGNDAHESFAHLGYDQRFVAEDYIAYFPYYKHYFEQFTFVDTSKIDVKQLPYPYNTLSHVLPYDSQGYYVNFEYITKLFAANKITTALEIGSDFGRSTRHIGSLLPDGGKLYAVDTWDFTVEGYNNTRYAPFLSNVIHVGLTDKIIPIRKSSQDAIYDFKLFGLTFDLIYVDGSHQTEDVIRDLELYYPMRSEHGILCGDDWLLKTVRAGVIEFAQKHQLTIYGACNFWFIRDEGMFQIRSFLEADESVWIF